MENKESQSQFLKDFAKLQFNLFFESKKDFRCWELFWKVDLEKIYSFYSFRQNLEKVKHDIFQKIDKMKPYHQLTQDDLAMFEKAKTEIHANYNIKDVFYEDMISLICEFFSFYRNIDFMSLTDKEQMAILNEEHYMDKDVKIHEFLQMTPVQFQILYQKGVVAI